MKDAQTPVPIHPPRAWLRYGGMETPARAYAHSRLPDPSATVTEELPCIGCGYLLRGLPVGGRCPECATPVMAAFIERTLAFADPRWLGRLQFAPRLLLASGICLIVTPFAAAIATSNWRSGSLWGTVALVAAILGLTLMAASCWCAASPNPTKGRATW